MDSKFFRQYRIIRNEVIFTNYKKFLALVKGYGLKYLQDEKALMKSRRMTMGIHLQSLKAKWYIRA